MVVPANGNNGRGGGPSFADFDVDDLRVGDLKVTVPAVMAEAVMASEVCGDPLSGKVDAIPAHLVVDTDHRVSKAFLGAHACEHARGKEEWDDQKKGSHAPKLGVPTNWGQLLYKC